MLDPGVCWEWAPALMSPPAPLRRAYQTGQAGARGWDPKRHLRVVLDRCATPHGHVLSHPNDVLRGRRAKWRGAPAPCRSPAPSSCTILADAGGDFALPGILAGKERPDSVSRGRVPRRERDGRGSGRDTAGRHGPPSPVDDSSTRRSVPPRQRTASHIAWPERTALWQKAMAPPSA